MKVYVIKIVIYFLFSGKRNADTLVHGYWNQFKSKILQNYHENKTNSSENDKNIDGLDSENTIPDKPSQIPDDMRAFYGQYESKFVPEMILPFCK